MKRQVIEHHNYLPKIFNLVANEATSPHVRRKVPKEGYFSHSAILFFFHPCSPCLDTIVQSYSINVFFFLLLLLLLLLLFSLFSLFIYLFIYFFICPYNYIHIQSAVLLTIIVLGYVSFAVPGTRRKNKIHSFIHSINHNSSKSFRMKRQVIEHHNYLPKIFNLVANVSVVLSPDPTLSRGETVW